MSELSGLEEVSALMQALQISQEDRGGLNQQVEKLICTMDEMKKERIEFAKAVEIAQHETAELQMAWSQQQKNMDGQLANCVENARQWSEEFKTLAQKSEKLAADHQNEVELLRARIDELQKEKIQLKEELTLYKEHGGVIALD